MICSSESGILSEPINGCNAIDIAYVNQQLPLKSIFAILYILRKILLM